MSKNDFPQINKLFRRFEYHYLQKKENTLNFVDNDDLSKLNIKKQGMLTELPALTKATLDSIDNELNHLIHYQIKESKISNSEAKIVLKR